MASILRRSALGVLGAIGVILAIVGAYWNNVSLIELAGFALFLLAVLALFGHKSSTLIRWKGGKFLSPLSELFGVVVFISEEA